MTVRTSHKRVTFTQPFSLSGFDEVQLGRGLVGGDRRGVASGLSVP